MSEIPSRPPATRWERAIANALMRHPGVHDVAFQGDAHVLLLKDADDERLWLRFRLDHEARAFLAGEYPHLSEPKAFRLLTPRGEEEGRE